jgi:EAL and modified HD-GYP domain-containing signal transduction protein
MTMFKRLFSGLFPAKSVKAPVAPQPSPSSEPSRYLRRDPVLDRGQGIVGYRFVMQHPEGTREWSESSRHFFDEVLLDRLDRLDLEALTGRRQAYLELEPTSLSRPGLDRLAAMSTVVKLASHANQAPLPADIGTHAQKLAQMGLRFMLPEHGVETFTPLAQGVHLSVNRVSPPDLMAKIRDLRSHHPGKLMMATDVDSVELYDACKRLGFDLFEGRHLTQRGEQRPPNLNSQRLVVTQVISHLRRKDANFDKLAMLARQDLALTLRLLRYINSAAMGLRHKVGTLEQAMTYIGRDGLYRWLTLLLFYDSRQSPVDTALRETALARGRFCELLARKRLAKAECEQAFVTGLLSLVDVLFSMPMTDALGHLGLPDEIHAALARQEGKYGTFIGLTLACEHGDTEAIATLSQALGLSPGEVDDLRMQALAWALEYGAGLESD